LQGLCHAAGRNHAGYQRHRHRQWPLHRPLEPPRDDQPVYICGVVIVVELSVSAWLFLQEIVDG
jgi:hypothetical protein